MSDDKNIDQLIDDILDYYSNNNEPKVNDTNVTFSKPEPLDPSLSLNQEQKSVFDAIAANPCGLHVVTGNPGTGKSFLIQYLHHYFHEQQKNVLLAASTGVAALKLAGGMTIDKVCAMSHHDQYSTTILSTLPAYKLNQAANVYIIDEAYMLTRGKFDVILRRLYSCCHEDGYSFEQFMNDKLIILVGDRNQLPPVCHCNARTEAGVCFQCNLENSSLLQTYGKPNFHHLRCSVRHSEDKEWSDFLASISTRIPSQDYINKIFGDLVLEGENEWYDYVTRNNALSIHGTNEQASSFGKNVLLSQTSQQTFKANPIVVYPNDSQECQQDLQCLIKCRTPTTVTTLAIGCEVMFTQNINFKRGIINGLTATVVEVGYRNDQGKIIYTATPAPHEDPAALRLRLHHNNKLACIHRNQNKFASTKGAVTIQFFSIILANSITAHKSQGATITKPVLIDNRNIFVAGQLNVMVSRVKKRSQIRLTKLPQPKDFIVFSTDPEIASLLQQQYSNPS